MLSLPPLGSRTATAEPSHDRVGTTPPAIRRLAPLLSAAAELDPVDTAGWRRVRDDAAHALADLVLAGELPARYWLPADASAATIERVLTGAWRHLTGPMAFRHHRGT
jgi:hypothetical protein